MNENRRGIRYIIEEKEGAEDANGIRIIQKQCEEFI